jgi:acetoin utilization deacetylase AcuC-like enzyme
MNPVAYSLVRSVRHDFEDHPENPRRFQDFEALLQGLSAGQQLALLLPGSCPMELVLRVHPAAYLEALAQAAAQGPAIIDFAPTYVTPSSYDDALLAAGAVVEVATKVWHREASSGFALIRPSSHNATATQAMGFCLLNNIAIAARRLQAPGPAREDRRNQRPSRHLRTCPLPER